MINNDSTHWTFKRDHVKSRHGADVDGGEVVVPGDGHGVQVDVREAVQADVLQPAVNVVEVLSPLEVEGRHEAAEVQRVQHCDVSHCLQAELAQ